MTPCTTPNVKDSNKDINATPNGTDADKVDQNKCTRKFNLHSKTPPTNITEKEFNKRVQFSTPGHLPRAPKNKKMSNSTNISLSSGWFKNLFTNMTNIDIPQLQLLMWKWPRAIKYNTL